MYDSNRDCCYRVSVLSDAGISFDQKTLEFINLRVCFFIEKFRDNFPLNFTRTRGTRVRVSRIISTSIRYVFHSVKFFSNPSNNSDVSIIENVIIIVIGVINGLRVVVVSFPGVRRCCCIRCRNLICLYYNSIPDTTPMYTRNINSTN